MSIYVSEPGRPVGTRLPEIFRGRRVGEVTELTETHKLDVSHSENTDAEFQMAARSGRHRALEEYGSATAGEPKERRLYLPVSQICTPTLFSLPATATVADALETMEENGIHHIVITADGNVAGLVDLRWLLTWLHESEDHAPDSGFVNIELPAFLTASPETDAHQLARLMLAHQLSAALVVDETGRPAGVVTSTDYLRLYASAGRHEGSV
ncbi:CBS domain-containing protein [Marinobacter orientalis]|uniref:CBS domain-containing protein n=1 Tax=Marinobacter orientalis TaxID=1928859 RepID=A0A7Y0REP5_9GAMM|nr:CBS domain-containing protein [Marinobacter orientalis]NMT64831.1 CBS domain-containing protein [Marinobacter orientalis]TGX48821.1 CBS domain-containing protein [Marinobacter orientalis]